MSNFIALESDALRRIYNESVNDEIFREMFIYYGSTVYAFLLNVFSMIPFLYVYMQWVRPGTFELYEHLKEEPRGKMSRDGLIVSILGRIGWQYLFYYVTGINLVYLVFLNFYQTFLYLIQGDKFNIHMIGVLFEYNWRFRILVFLSWSTIMSVFYDPMYMAYALAYTCTYRVGEFWLRYDSIPVEDRERINRIVMAYNLQPLNIPVEVDWTRLF